MGVGVGRGERGPERKAQEAVGQLERRRLEALSKVTGAIQGHGPYPRSRALSKVTGAIQGPP